MAPLRRAWLLQLQYDNTAQISPISPISPISSKYLILPRPGSSYALCGQRGQRQRWYCSSPCSYAKKVNKRVKKQSNLGEAIIDALLGTS